MLAHKADPTLVKGGDPPLMCAVVSDNAELVEALLHAGADVGQPSAYANIATTCTCIPTDTRT